MRTLAGIAALLTLTLTAPPHIAHAQAAPPFQFSDAAYVSPANLCAADYTKIDDCANKDNPPLPSIVRNLEWALRGDPLVSFSRATDMGSAEPNYAGAPSFARLPSVPPAGRTEIMPYARSTADGRLLLHTRWSWPLALVPYRPENVQADWKTGSTPTLPARFSEGGTENLHPLVWLDPRDTMWTGLDPTSGNPELPVTLHSTICEETEVAVCAPNDPHCGAHLSPRP